MSIKLPSLEQDIDIDTSNLARAIALADAFGDKMSRSLNIDDRKFRQAAAGINKDMEDMSGNADKASRSFSDLGDSVSQFNTRIQAARNGLQNLRQDMSNLDRDTRNVSNNFIKITDAVTKLGEAARRSRQHLRGYGDDLRHIGDNVGNAGANLRALAGNVENLEDTFRRSGRSIQDYNDALANMRNAGGGTGPRLGEDFRDQSEAANRAEHELDELRQAAARLAATLVALEAMVGAVNERLDKLGSGSDTAEIEHLKSEIEELKRELLGVAGAAAPASHGINKVGKEAREAAGDVALLSGALAVMNAAIAPEIITKASKIGTIFELIAGVAGAAGAGIGQLLAGGVGIGQALAPIGNLVGILPSAITGIALLGVTIKSAFNTEVANEFTEQIKANKKAFEDLSNTIVTKIQSETTPAMTRLVDAAKNLSPVLEEGFRKMGRTVSEVMDDISGDFFLSNPEFQDKFVRLFDSAAIQARNYGYVATNSLFAVTTMAAKGIPVAEKLSEFFKDMSNRFMRFTQQAADSGALEAAFERGYQALMRVFTMVGNLGVGLVNLGRVAKSVGLDETILQSFERGANGIRNFARTYQTELTGTFNNAKGLADSLGRIISNIARAVLLDLGQINLAPLADQLARTVEIVGKIALPAGNSLVKGFTEILNAVNNARGPLINISTVLSSVIDSLARFGASVIPHIIGPLQQISVEVARFVSDVADIAADLVPSLTDPLVQVVASSRRMVTAIIELVAPLVKQIAQPFADAFSLIQDTIANVANQVSGPLQSAFGNVLPALADAFREVVPAVGELITKIIELVAAFSNSFGGAITGVVAILSPIIGVFTAMAEAAALLPDPIKAIVVALLGLRIMSGLGPMIGTFAGHLGGLGQAIRAASAGAGGGLAGLRAGLGQLVTFLGGPWGIVLAGAATALVLFGMSQQDAKQQAAEYEARLKELASTMDQVTGAATALTAKKVGENLIDNQSIDNLQRFGSNLGEVVNAIDKGGSTMDGFKNKVVASFLSAVEGSERYQKAITDSTDESSSALRELQSAYKVLGEASSFSLQSLAQAWANGNNAYTAYAQKIASETGLTADQVKVNFEIIRSAINDATGGGASDLTALGNALGEVEDASVSVRTIFEGVAAGAADALRDVQGFSNVTNGQLLSALDSAHARGIPVRDALKEIGVTGAGAATVIASLGDYVDGASGKLTGMGDKAREIERALIGLQDAANKGIPGAEKLAEAFGTMGDQASTAADKARALQDILEVMNGGTKDLQKAQFDWAESLDQVRAKITDLNTENAGFVQGLNDTGGELDKNNQQHREFRNQLEGMVDDYASLNASIYEQTKASSGQAAALDAVYRSATDQRKAFIDTMQQMGFSAQAAAKLADAMGLIPEEVRIAFAMDGTGELVQKQIAGIIAKLENMPEGKITVDNPDGSMDEALKKMEELGYTVSQPINGKVTITDNMAAVREQLNSVMSQIATIPEGKLNIAKGEVTDQTLQALETLGYKVNELPEGRVEILSNAAQVQADVDGMIAKIGGIPEGAVVVNTSDITQGALPKLEELGYKISYLPNGQVVITGPDSSVQAQIDSIASQVTSIPEGSVTVKADLMTLATKLVLEAMGFVITTLPNGEVKIESNTDDEQAKLEGIKSDLGNMPNGVLNISEGAITETTRANLEALGLKVSQPMNGTVTITGNVPTATAEVSAFQSLINQEMSGTGNITTNAPTATAEVGAFQSLINQEMSGSANITTNAPVVAGEVAGLAGQVATPMNGSANITTNAPTVQGEVEGVGAATNALPDGSFKIDDNTPEVNTRIDGVESNINALPDKTVRITADTGQALSAIADVSSRVQGIPNKTVNIDVTTSGVGAAESSINSAARSRTATITVQTVNANAGGGIFAPMATGGVIERRLRPIFNAIGNYHQNIYDRARRSPMQNHMATIVPPNTPRVIGDNMRRDELFMPIDPYSSSAQALLRIGAFRMGWDLVPRSTRKAGGPMFFAEGGLTASQLRQNMMRAGRQASDALLSRTTITAALRGQSAVIANAIANQTEQLRKVTASTDNRESVAAGSNGIVNQFTFHQYNPQLVPADEMINAGLQVVAAAGLMG